MVPSRPSLPSHYTNLSIARLLDIIKPGSALDTVYGKYILEGLHHLTVNEYCSTASAYVAYEACVLASDDKSERNKFNILQFAHQLLVLRYHGTQCSRLEHFTACWKLLQQICGHKVQGMKQHATLLVEGCKIQSELDIVGCHWQDMLLPHYIQASRVTVWPTNGQCLQNPMFVEDTHYGTFNSVLDDLDNVISHLQPGFEEISRKCGLQHAERLSLLLNKLRYPQRDAMKYMSSLLNDVRETT